MARELWTNHWVKKCKTKAIRLLLPPLNWKPPYELICFDFCTTSLICVPALNTQLSSVSITRVVRVRKEQVYSSYGHLCARDVSRKSRNFTGYFRVSQFPLYLKNGEDKFVNLHSHFSFCGLENMLKDRISKTSGWQFQTCLFGPEKFSGLSRNGPLARVARSMLGANQR